MAKLQYPAIIEKDEKFHALADLSKRLNLLDKSQIITGFVDLVPSQFLELLAEKWSVTGYDGWLLAESEDAKRKLIKRAVELHRYKGTPWAMREIIRQLGFGEVQIIEGLGNLTFNGQATFNNLYRFGNETSWAEYAVILNAPITQEQAQLLTNVLRYFAPARCLLERLDFQAVALKYDGKATWDGNYTFGTVSL